MRSFFSWPIRAHLVLLVLLAVVPALALLWRGGEDMERQAEARAGDMAMRLAERMAGDVAHVEGNAHVLLAAVAEEPSVRDMDARRAGTLLAGLNGLNEVYLRLALIAPDGHVVVMSKPASRPLNVADRAYFRDVLRTRDFVVGGYAVSPASGRPALPFAAPVFGRDKRLAGVLCAVYDLGGLAETFRAAGLPAGSCMAVSEIGGARLFRYPHPGSWVGAHDPAELSARLSALGGSGVAEATGGDGVRRLYAVKRLRSGHGAASFLTVRVGVPVAAPLAAARRAQFRNVGLMALAAALAVGLAWVLGNFIIMRRLRRLMSAAKRVGQGDFSARSGLGHGEGELGELAETFDSMALALETREAERREFEDRLHRQTLYDPLTGLPNRTLALDRVQRALARFRRRDDLFYAVVIMDLDRFKIINDSLGHVAGDHALSMIARRVMGALRGLDTVARLGSDEFILLLEDMATPGESIRIVKRVRQAVMEPLPVAGREVRISASFGLVLSPNTFEQAEDVLQSAAIALHHVKADGGGRFKVFTPRMLTSAVERLTLEQELRLGLDRGEFEVFYQPIWDLAKSRLVGFEALARWRHPQRGLVGPEAFIGLAEETGLILDLGRIVLERACSDLARWRAADPAAEGLVMAVNLSNRQFTSFSLVEQVQDILKRTGLPPERLKLEITESTIMVNAESALVMLRRLKALGVAISIDDFGTGYSSLSYLQRFPVDTLKVDRSFVGRLGLEPENKEIIRAIVALAHSLGLDVVAEGVEESSQAEMLRSLGCENVQGFYFSRPLDEERAREAISRGEAA